MLNNGLTGVHLYKLEITQDGLVTERHLGPGLVLIGGGLQADLVVATLLDAELCEVALPPDSTQPLRVTALVEGLVVNGRALKTGQSLSAPEHELAIDNVTIRIMPAEAAMPDAAPKTSERLIDWLEQSKNTLPSHGAVGLVRDNPAYVLFGAAALFALVAFLISGLPSAKFKLPTDALNASATAARDTMTSTLTELRRRFASADLGPFVRAEANGGAIRLSGSANPQQAQRLDDIIKLVSKPGGIAIRNEVVMTSADAATGVESIVTAPMRGVVVTGGQMFSEGQTIPSGWTIEKIAQNEVRMKRDSIEHVIIMKETAPELQASAGAATLPAQKATALLNPLPKSLPKPARMLESISSPPREETIGPAMGPTASKAASK